MICTRCNIEKSPSDFYKEKYKKSGYSSHCKSCKNKSHTKRAQSPSARLKANKRSKDYRQKNSDAVRMGVKMAVYKKLGLKINKEQYQNLYAIQNGYCAICEKHRSTQKKDLSLDHDHNTGQIRGFLCDNCNTALGKFKDDTSLLLKAIEYIVKHR